MKMQSCLLSLFMGIVVSSHASDFPVPLEKPSSIKSLSDVPEDIKALGVLLKENKLEEFYKKSREWHLKSYPHSEDIVSVRKFFWLAYYVSFAPLFPFEDDDCRTTASFNDNIDLRLLGDVFDRFLKIARNDLDEFTTQQPLKRKELAPLFSLYAARMLNRVRNAYVDDLPNGKRLPGRIIKKRLPNAWKKQLRWRKNLIRLERRAEGWLLI